MPYRRRDEHGDIIDVPVEFKPAPDHKIYYANNIQGGIHPSYHFRLDFCRDDLPGLEGTERGGNLYRDEESIKRTIVASVCLSLPAAKQLCNWMHLVITSYEQDFGEIQLPGQAKMQEEE